MCESIVQVGGAVRHQPLPSLVNYVENNNEHEENIAENNVNLSKDVLKASIGSFIGEGQLTWRAVGPSIEVIDTQTCMRQAAWTFGAILHNKSAVVTCVCGIGIGPVTHIVVGVDLGNDQNPQGMVGVLSLRRSRIIRAFTFHHKVTNVCMVTGGEKNVDSSTLASELRSCQGLLAVATSHASLYLVDLGLDLGDEITSDEMSPAPFVEICIPDAESEIRRNKAIASHYHPMLCLTENMNMGKTFSLMGPDDNILYEAPRNSVSISSVLYVPQIASLIVGYSFGSFQIINLNLITIDCASPYEDNLPPVFSFAYQEPENDPRSFVYLWVCRSLNEDKNAICNSDYPLLRNTCSLYAMNYEKKEWIEGHGLWYQNLVSISPRFDFQTVGGIGEKVCNSTPSRMISAMTVVGTTPAANLSTPFVNLINDALLSSEEDSGPVPELSLCLFCWEANILSHGKVVTQHYIAIFDINQWYQSHMPSSLRLDGNNLCPYMSFHILDKVPKSVDETILGGIPQRGSWSRHSSRAHCEKIWYPSALSYEFNLLTSEGLATYRCPSVQQSAISALVQQGPGAVVNPHPSYDLCIFSGILSSFDGNSNGSLLMGSEREQILNTALEYHLLSLLVQCAVEFSEGRFSHMGCSSQMLLDWAWKRIRSIKTSYDNICIPLFGCPTDVFEPLSAQNLMTLHQHLTYLSHLSTIVTSIRDNAKDVTTTSAVELEGRVQVVSLLHLHLQVTLWFYHCGLLPEHEFEECPDEASVPFPAELLRTIYNQRRKEIKEFTSSSNCPILLIDSIIEGCGQLLSEIWDVEIRDEEAGLYPPPSLHSFLSMYLCPGMSTSTKHRIVQYLFLDLTSLLSENYTTVLEELVRFPSSFSLSPSLIKLTQAFWQIDHKDFQAGLSALLDPLVNPSDITLDQHRRIIKAFLYQGEVGLALTYSQKRQPPKVELEDIRMNITLMLANGRVREAFHYQRKQRVNANAKDLLYHMFEGCQESGRLECIVHLPMSSVEEEYFISYLKESKRSSAQDLLLVYYLQQSRYTEISSFHDSTYKANNFTMKHQKQETRSAIVQGYLSHLPDVRNQMSRPVKSRPARLIYTKPRPLSAKVRQSSAVTQTPKSKASIIRSSLYSKVEDFKTRLSPLTPFRSKAQRRMAIHAWTEEVGLEKKKNPEQSVMDLTSTVFPKNSKSLSRSAVEVTPTTNKVFRDIGTTSGANGSLLMNEKDNLQLNVSKLMEDFLMKSIHLPNNLMSIENESLLVENMKLSQEIVSLLKTPPVKRTSFSNKTNNSIIGTPQSILKVRKILEDSQSISEVSTPVSTFPLHRLSSRSSRDGNQDKFDGGSELGNLTPKQLRFDLPLSGKFTPDEQIDEKLEEERQSFNRKRKRDDSPSSDNSAPTPRKPLPRFSFEDQATNVKSRVTISQWDEHTHGQILRSKSGREFNKALEKLSTSVSQINDSGLFLENNDRNSRISVLSSENNLEAESSLESLQEDSFHSVEDYHQPGSSNANNIPNLTNEKIVQKLQQSKSLRPEYSSEVASPISGLKNRDSTVDTHESSSLEANEEPSDEPVVISDHLIEPEEAKQEMGKSVCVDMNFTTDTSGKLQLSGTRSPGIELSKAAEEDESLQELIKGESEDKEVKVMNNFDGLQREKISQNEKLDSDNVMDEIYIDESINNKETVLAEETHEPSKENLGFSEYKNGNEILENGDIHEDVNLGNGSELDNSPNTSYVLRFSDSDEESLGESGVAEKTELNHESLSRKNTLLVSDNNSDSLSKADTVILEKENEGSVVANSLRQSTRKLPSDLENVSAFCMTTKEREIVDLMMEESSLSFNHLHSAIKIEDNLVPKDSIPILEYSESEESDDDKSPSLNLKNRLKPELEESKSNDSDSTVEFNESHLNLLPVTSNVESSRAVNSDSNSSEASNVISTEIDNKAKEFDNSEGKKDEIVQFCQDSEDKRGIASDECEMQMEKDKLESQKIIQVDQCEDKAPEHSKETEIEVEDGDQNADSILKVPDIEKTDGDFTTHNGNLEAKEVDITEGDTVYKMEEGTDVKSSLTQKDDTLERPSSAPLPIIVESQGEMNVDVSTNNNNNNNLPEKTPLKDEVRPTTPSRRSTIMKRLDTDAIIETSYPSTPVRRSRRLSGSTPSKYTSPGRQLKKKIETPSKSDNINGHITGENVSIPEPLRIEEEENPLEEKKMDVILTPGDVCDAPLIPKEDDSVEKDSVTNTGTPRRRSARLSGSKESLGTIVNIESSFSQKSRTPKKSTPTRKTRHKETPPRSRRKSGAQNSTVVEPLLETIQEDSELKNTLTPQELTTAQVPHHPSVSLSGVSRKASASKNKEITPVNEEVTTGQPTLQTTTRYSRRRSASESELNVSTSSLTSRKHEGNSSVRTRSRRYSGDVQHQTSIAKLEGRDIEDVTLEAISPEERFETASVTTRRLSSLSFRSSNSKTVPVRKSLHSLRIPSGFEKPSENSHGKDEEVNDGDAVVNKVEEPPALNEELVNGSEVYEVLDTNDAPTPKLRHRVWKKSRSSFRRGCTVLNIYKSPEKVHTSIDDGKRSKKKLKKVSGMETESGEEQVDKSEEKKENESKGFAFQNPEEIISISNVVSDLFKKLTEEQEKIVSENFVFSPPLSFSKKRRQTKRRKPVK